MRRTYGPILTTGVALAAAGVVVANPIVAPHADVQVPPAQLSAGSDDVASMLDKAFLDAIAPAPPESTNPFSVIKDLFTSLAADATDAGRNAIVNAFVAGITAVSAPELTASSEIYVAPLTDSPELAMSVLPGIDLSTIVPETGAAQAFSDLTSEVANTVAPAVKSFVSGLIHDAGYIGGQLVAAAFAAGSLVVSEPRLIGATLVALVNGDFDGALKGVVKIITAPLGPPAIVFNAVRTVVENQLSGLSGSLPEVARGSAPDSAGATPDETPADQPAPAPRGAAPLVSSDSGSGTGTEVSPAGVALSAAGSRAEAAEAPAVDSGHAAVSRGGHDGVQAGAESAGADQGAGATAASNSSDSSVSVGKVASRSRGGKPGPAAD